MNTKHDSPEAYTASMNKTQDIDRTVDRLLKNEEHSRRTSSFASSKQAQALRRKYQAQLADLINADRSSTGKHSGTAIEAAFKQAMASRGEAYRRRRKNGDVYRALKGIDSDELALRLISAGINVCEHDDFGTDDDGEKNLRDQMLWIGRDLCQHLNHKSSRELRFKVGRWGVYHLLDLWPIIFATDDDDIDDGDIDDGDPTFGGRPLRMTVHVDEIMDEELARIANNNRFISPLNVKPKDWTQVNTGGLPDDVRAMAPVQLIREHHLSIENAVRHAIGTGKMQKVLDAINSLQAVPFVINEPILKLIEHRKRPKPPGPKPKSWQQSFKKWSKRQNEFGTFYLDILDANQMACFERFWVPLNIDFRGRIYPISHFSFIRTDHIRALFKFADGAPIGEDGLWWLKGHVARSADGNEWSGVKKPSKLTRDGRVAWTDANEKTLRNIGEAVLRGDDPATLEWALKGLKDPYQFLAACAELAEALNVGPGFITRLPIMFDATCSGLQHLCAMTRAEEGKYVNLTAADEPDDFYGRVAASVNENLNHWYVKFNGKDEHGKDKIIQQFFPTEAERDDFAKTVDAFPLPDSNSGEPFITTGHIDEIDRGLVKQPVMSYFYGSRKGGFAPLYKGGPLRPHGMVKQVIKALKEEGRPTEGAKEIAYEIYRTIENMVPRAKKVRDFLQKLARICANKCTKKCAKKCANKKCAEKCAKDSTSLRLDTILDLPVINIYHKPDTKDFTVMLAGRRDNIALMVPLAETNGIKIVTVKRPDRRRRITLTVGDKEGIDPNGAADAVTANFVHSLDACLLQMVALAAAKEGIEIVTIHDCFGCLAPRAKRVNEIVREEFVRLHKHDLLTKVLESARRAVPKHIKLPSLPPRGKSDIEEVLKSPNFIR